MTKYLVNINHPTVGTQPVTLLGIENAQILTERDPNEVFYREKLSGSFKLKDGLGMLGSFTSLYSVLTGADRCEKITATIQELCSDDTVHDLFTGRLVVKEVCVDKCRATLSIEQDDIYSCVFDAWEKETNHFGVPTVTASATDVDSVIEQYTCDYQEVDTVPFLPIPAASYEACSYLFEESGYTTAQALAWSGLNVPLTTPFYTLAWCMKSTSVVNDGQNPDNTGNYALRVVTDWWREVISVPSASIMPAPWQLLDDNGTIARWWRCPFSAGGEVITLDNGRLLNEIIKFTVSDALTDCGVCQVVSDFLHLNSTGVTISNVAYDNAFKVQKAIVYQQSDVKRFNATENAGEGGNTDQFVWSLKQQLEFLKNTLNCFWIIEETGDPLCPYILRIEHISYFTSQGTVDLSNEFARNCYTYQKGNAPQTEEFKWRNPTNNNVFLGKPITYASACTEGKRTYDAGVNTDVQYIANPSNEDKVPDEGFVVVAADYIDTAGNYVINVEPGAITGTIHLNAALSWENIHERYWRHDRSLLQGNMNAVDTNFETAKTTIQAEEIRKKLCCGSSVDTDANYLTKPGSQPHINANGRLKRATLNLKTRTVIYEIEHSYA